MLGHQYLGLLCLDGILNLWIMNDTIKLYIVLSICLLHEERCGAEVPLLLKMHYGYMNIYIRLAIEH